MTDFYRPDYASNSNDPFARDSNGTLVRRGFWLDMTDKSLVLAMTVGVGSHLSNEQKKDVLNSAVSPFREGALNLAFRRQKKIHFRRSDPHFF